MIQTGVVFSKPSKITFLLIFLVAFAWLLIITQGLPAGDPDDWAHILISEDTSWSVFIQNFITPWSTSRAWVAQTHLEDQVIGSRLLHGLALKAVVSIFGHNFFAYYVFTKDIFFALSIALVFLLVFVSTRSILVALCASVFYALIPAHYTHAIWISAAGTKVHTFVLISVFCLTRMAIQLDHNDKPRKFWKWFFLMFVAGWFGMKAKETAIILPLAMGGFLCLRSWRWRKHWNYLVALFCLTAFLGLLSIPIENIFSESSRADMGRIFNFETLSRMLFRNYDCGYDNESVSAFFSREALFPVSIARTFGFYALWSLILFFVIYAIKRLRRSVDTFLNHPLVLYCSVWVLIELFLIGFFQPDPRYFSGTMIPLTILAARLIHLVIPIKGVTRLFVAAIAFFALSTAVFSNTQHVIWLRQQIGQRSNRFFNVARAIYVDQFPDKEITMRDIGLFYCPAYEPDVKQPRLKNFTYNITLDYSAVNNDESPSMQEFLTYARRGFIYWMTDQPDLVVRDNRVQEISVLNGINSESAFEALLYKLKKKKPVPYHIFKFQTLQSTL